jgi:hypothetical protein
MGAFSSKVRENQFLALITRLLDSVRRRPTVHTLWMLNRVINGTASREERQEFIAAMMEASTNPIAEVETRQRAHHFLDRLPT